MARHRIIPSDDPKFPAIRRRLIETWLKTIAGYLAMGGLIYGALALFNFSYEFKFGFGTLWLALPIVMWWFCDKIAIALQQAKPADPTNPLHAKLISIVEKVYAKSGLKYMPKIYVSPNPLPNAFATGPIHRKAVVAATEGLFLCGMTDEEIEAVFAHELGHVKNYDVAINSFLQVLSSIFFFVFDQGFRAWMGTISFFKRLLGIRETQPILPVILTNVIMYAVFWATGQITKIIQFFVVRSRESGADATGALMTGEPCHLANALLKLVKYVEDHRPKGHQAELFRVMRPIMIIDPLFDSRTPAAEPKTLWQKIVRWWKSLQLTHPPVPERVYELERMAGGKCPAPQYPDSPKS